MIKDRICLFTGGVLSLFCSGVMVIAGSRLVYTVSLLAEPDSGLQTDFDWIVLTSAGLGAGLVLVAYALGLARRGRSLSLSAKLMMIFSGLLIAAAGVLLYYVFTDLTADLNDLDESGYLRPAAVGLDEEIVRISDHYLTSAAAGFLVLLMSQIMLGISLWALFWSDFQEPLRKPMAVPVVTAAVLAATGAAALLLWAAKLGTQAMLIAPANNAALFADVRGHLDALLVRLRFAFGCLAGYGAVITLMSLFFPGERN